MGTVVLYFWGCVGKPKDCWGYPLELGGGVGWGVSLGQKGRCGGTFLLVLEG